jgi:hypothetical protein
MEDSRAVLERLARIEALDRDGAPPTEVLDELRSLLREAEVWARREGGDAGARAVADLREALDSMQARNVLAHVPCAPDP